MILALGIDVSKLKLDVHLNGKSFEVNNDSKSIKKRFDKIDRVAVHVTSEEQAGQRPHVVHRRSVGVHSGMPLKLLGSHLDDFTNGFDGLGQDTLLPEQQRAINATVLINHAIAHPGAPDFPDDGIRRIASAFSIRDFRSPRKPDGPVVDHTQFQILARQVHRENPRRRR